MPASFHHRRGISLLEVLISMGILTIGLVSVLSLVPAGRSQALKAGAIDRSSALSMNAAADFINRGYLRPAGWRSGDGTQDWLPSAGSVALVAIFDPLMPGTSWSGVPLPATAAFLRPKVDAVITTSSTNNIFQVASTLDIIARSEDDIRYSTDNVGADDPPAALWSGNGTPGRHVFDGNFSYLATLSGTSASWNPGDYKTLTIVTFNRRDTTLGPVELTADTVRSVWNVSPTNVPAGMTLKDLIKPGAMVLYKTAATPPLQWLRVLLSSDATDPSAPSAWKVSLTCEQTDPVASAANTVYVFPGASGSLQMPVRLEGTSPWND